jgi:hypothetical protein
MQVPTELILVGDVTDQVCRRVKRGPIITCLFFRLRPSIPSLRPSSEETHE